MSISNVFYETIFFSPIIPTLPQFRAPHQEYRFDGQNIMFLDRHETLARANFLIPFHNSNLHMPKGLDAREVTRTSKSSCLYGLTSGIAASFLLENPLPLWMGLSECFPRAYAQQKVGNEFRANSYTTNNQDQPSVASFSNGNFVVIWISLLQDGSGFGIYGQLFDENGTKIGNEFRANSYTTNDQDYPSVTSFSNGNFVVTWASLLQDGSIFGVYGQLFDGNGTKIGNEFRANSYTNFSQARPSIASFSNGNFVVTWESNLQDSSYWGVYGQLFDGNGTKIGNEFQVNTYITLDQGGASVSSFSNNNFVVTWQSDGQDGSSWGVFVQLFDGNGAKIGSEFRASSYTINDQYYPSVASLSNGNFVVTWDSQGQDGSGEGVYGQLFDGNGAKIGSEFRANTYTTNDQYFSSVASFSNGNFVVAWQSDGQDGSSWGVFVQLFDGNGAKIGGEFQVNTYATDIQAFPSVASSVDGNFVVTWSSYGQDGSDYGVYAQIFHDNITYPSSSTTTSSSTKSMTTITSYTTSNISSSTLSAIGRTKTSVNLSSSRTAVPSTTRPISTSNRKATLSATSDPSNRFSWIWFLLGGVGAIFCLGLTGYLIFKSRKKDGNVHAFDLGEREQTDGSTEDPGHVYSKTPDFVTEQAGKGPTYAHTPDFVSAGDEK